LVIFAIIQLTSIALADQTAAILLPGSSQSVVETFATASNVVIAKFTAIGGPAAVGGGVEICNGGKISILKTLRGNVAGQLNAKYELRIFDKVPESPPNLNDSYICMMYDSNTILKIIPATAENISTIKKLIAGRQSK
jgi:hypothetical protein